ncbi:MAG: MurR/RpiR family transcriptional regulator [Coprobacillus sp.]
MNFIDLVKIKYDTLTSSEKKIADYIVLNSEQFLQLNAQSIGDVTGTSGASVIRLCKKLDFEGLEQLKVNVAKNNLDSHEDNEIDPILQADDSNEAIVSKIYSHIDFALKKTASLIDFNVLSQVLSVIRNADSVFLYGIGASSLSAYDLYHKFNRVNKKTFYNFDGHMNIEFSVHSQPQDVAIAISYGGDSKEILLAAKQLKQNNTPIIAIVEEGVTPLSQIADYCLYIPNTEKRVKMGAVSSKFSQSFLVDVIYFGVVKNNLDLVFEQLKLTAMSVRPLKEKK